MGIEEFGKAIMDFLGPEFKCPTCGNEDIYAPIECACKDWKVCVCVPCFATSQDARTDLRQHIREHARICRLMADAISESKGRIHGHEHDDT